VLSLYLLVMRGAALTCAERCGLIVLTAVAAATHSATLAVLLVLMAAAALLFLFDRERMPARALARGAMALMLGAVLVLGADFIVAKRLAWTPGGYALSFGRMLQDGIVKKYLDEHCPDPALRLCAYKDQLPDDADVWFWGSPLFDRLGRFAGLDPEMEKIALASLVAYPGLQAQTALTATARQLVDVHTGEGVLNAIWHTYAIIERYTPQVAGAMRAARQQNGGIAFAAINRLHYPVALLSMALLPLIVLAARRKWVAPDIGQLAAVAALALFANAFVCGALSNPHDRYGARMVWLATLAVALALVRWAAPRLGKVRNLP
jgi:lipoprotein signal peptidase